MSIKEIIDKCSTLEVKEQRTLSEDYCELVFFNKDESQWQKTLSEFLGPAVKPAGKEPSPRDEAVTEEFGGIFPNQTLFQKETQDALMLAMFWPWQDKVHITLKIALLKP
ncbi:MAG: hypothetical protein V1727_02865 [Candidatus Omnitrophota bacterium]